MKTHSNEKIDTIISSKGRFEHFRSIILLLIISALIMSWINVPRNYRIFLATAIIIFIINYIIIIRRGIKRLKMKISIDEVEKNGKTGDIILFKPNNNHDISDLILFKMIPVNLSGDMWTHIGILYRDPDRNNNLFIWESNDIKSNDKYTKKSKTGVKMINFSKRIKSFDGITAICEVKKNINPNEMIKKIKPCSRFPYSNIESLLGKPNIRRGINSCQFIERIIKGMNLNCNKKIISTPIALVGNDYDDPKMIV